MSIKNILCAYSGEAARGSGLSYAIKLAKRHDAWLTGVLRHGQPRFERQFLGQLPDEVIEHLRRADAERVIEVKNRFSDRIAAAGLAQKSEFVDLKPAVDGPISHYARNFDLVVTGIHTEVLNEAHMSANPDLITLHSGRPVLVVPNNYQADAPTDHIVVAMDGKRAAARALWDAMSLLGEKVRVTVVTVGNDAIAHSDVLMRNLERHQIEAEYRLASRKGSVANSILGIVEEVSADLIVSGSYEHSKFAHSLIGGVSTELMEKTKVPILLSH